MHIRYSCLLVHSIVAIHVLGGYPELPRGVGGELGIALCIAAFLAGINDVCCTVVFKLQWCEHEFWRLLPRIAGFCPSRSEKRRVLTGMDIEPFLIFWHKRF